MSPSRARRMWERLFKVKTTTAKRHAHAVMWGKVRYHVRMIMFHPTGASSRVSKLRQPRKRGGIKIHDIRAIAFKRHENGKLTYNTPSMRRVRSIVRSDNRHAKRMIREYVKYIRLIYSRIIPTIPDDKLSAWISEHQLMLASFGVKIPKRKLPKGVPGSNPDLRIQLPFSPQILASKRDDKGEIVPYDKDIRALFRDGQLSAEQTITHVLGSAARTSDDLRQMGFNDEADRLEAWLAQHKSWHQGDSRRRDYFDFQLVKRGRKAKKLMRKAPKHMDDLHHIRSMPDGTDMNFWSQERARAAAQTDAAKARNEAIKLERLPEADVLPREAFPEASASEVREATKEAFWAQADKRRGAKRQRK